MIKSIIFIHIISTAVLLLEIKEQFPHGHFLRYTFTDHLYALNGILKLSYTKYRIPTCEKSVGDDTVDIYIQRKSEHKIISQQNEETALTIFLHSTDDLCLVKVKLWMH